MLVADWGGTEYAWSSPVILGLAAVALAAWALFFYSQSRVAEPIIPLRLFRSRIFNIATLIGMITVGVGMFAVVSYMPTYLQMVYGLSATVSGVMLLPLVLGLMGTSIASGRWMSRNGRYKLYPIIGSATVAVTFLLLSTLDAGSSEAVLCGYLFLLGLGLGLLIQTLVLAVQNAFPVSDVGTATSSNNFFREIGATLGIATVGAIFTSRLADQLASRLTSSDLRSIGGADSLTPALVNSLPDHLHDAVVAAYQHALTPVFAYLVPVLLIGLVLAFVLPEKRIADHERNEGEHKAPDTHSADRRPKVPTAD
ncbi:MFS transporter [Streptomyces sp. NPDC058464]|uniref:MFS transporter n=1 Tax=Streptomyces sp. NPDC058464 TaxID=3346511 RepID=UPI0036555908